MGLFNKVVKKTSGDDTPNINWIPLTNVSQLDTIVASEKTSIIFKHSTRCFISQSVLNQFQKDFNTEEVKVDMYFLDLLVCRSISNEIENRFGVYHESPQLIIIKNGKVIAHNSHSGINTIALQDYI